MSEAIANAVNGAVNLLLAIGIFWVYMFLIVGVMYAGFHIGCWLLDLRKKKSHSDSNVTTENKEGQK